MSSIPAPSGRPSVPWLADLRADLLAVARADINQTCKVAVLLAAHCTRADIGQRLGIEHREVESAIKKLRAVRADERPANGS